MKLSSNTISVLKNTAPTIATPPKTRFGTGISKIV